MLKRIVGSAICVLFSAAICSASTVIYLGDFVDGISGSTGWASAIGVDNPGSATANITITITQDNGTAFNVLFKDEQKNLVGSGNTIQYQIGPGQSKFFSSQAAGALASGFATVTSDQPVVAGIVFEEFIVTPTSATLIAEAGVQPATPALQHTIFAIRSKNDSGIAIANVGTATGTFTFQLMDTTGAVIVPPVTRTLGSNNHTAFLLSQLFPNAPDTIFGTLRITSTSMFVVTSLLIELSGQFATLPIIQ